MVDRLAALPLAVTVSIVRDSACCTQPRTGENDNGAIVEETPYQITGSVNFCSEWGHRVLEGIGTAWATMIASRAP